MKNEVNITTSSTEMMTISRAEYESLKAERDELNQKLDWLMEQVRLAKKKVYGTSSEQTKEELVGQLSFMFDETEAWLEDCHEGNQGCRSYPAEAILPCGGGSA